MNVHITKKVIYRINFGFQSHIHLVVLLITERSFLPIGLWIIGTHWRKRNIRNILLDVKKGRRNSLKCGRRNMDLQVLTQIIDSMTGCMCNLVH